MTTLLLCFVYSQIAFIENNPITLATDKFSFEQVTAIPNGLLISSQQEYVVHVFDLNGKKLASLGDKGGEEELTLPGSAAWLPDKRQYYVYDAALRSFFVFDEQYQFVEKLATNFPSFFEVGPLVEVKNGYVASISLSNNRYLLGHFNAEFNNTSYGYELANQELAKMSPVLYRSFVARADLFTGTRVLALQSLEPGCKVMDINLQAIDSISLEVPGWKRPKLSKLAKISKNPRELEKYQDNYSEMVSLQTVTGTLFVVGFRNVLSGHGYYFQCYDSSTSNAVGTTYNVAYPPLGSGYKRIYLRNPATPMALIPVDIM